MNVCTYSEAKRNLALVLEQAIQEGEARIRRRDGQIFVVRPEKKVASPLDVKGVDLGMTTAEIVQFIQESRRSAAKDAPVGASSRTELPAPKT